MDDFCEDEDLDEYFNDPESLVSVMPHDDHDEYQRIQEELYQEAFEAEFNRAASFHNSLSSHGYQNVKDCDKAKESSVHDVSEAHSEKKRKRNNKSDKLLNKKQKINGLDNSEESKYLDSSHKEKSKSNTKKSSKLKAHAGNHSLKEMVEDAGLTMNDLQAFIKEDKNDCGSDSMSDSSSNYVVISETSENESNELENESDDESIDVNIVSNSLSKEDSTLSRILSSLPDDSSWNISTSDIVGQCSSSIPRFHNLMKKVRCSNCNERGHYTSLCPHPKKVTKCILCGETGHMYRSCPDQLCFKCDLPGHSARDCSMRVASYHDRCKRCFARGHFEEKCPDTWRQYHLTISEGKILRERDIKKEEIVQREKIRSCYNCGEFGHLGHACQESRMDKFQTACTPYIFKYDRDYGQCEKTKLKRKDKGTKDENSKLSKLVKGRDDRKDIKHKKSLEEEYEGYRSSTVKGNLFEKGSDISQESSKSKRESFNKNDDSYIRIDLGNHSNDFDCLGKGHSKNLRNHSANVIPLMDLDIPACSSTPLVRSIYSKRQAAKFVETESFPRDTPSNSTNKKRMLNFFSPIVPTDSNNFNMSPERIIDSYMGESEMQSSYYGSKEMKKARKKQARKEKKLLLKEQLREAKDKGAKHKKQWWSVSKSQKHERLQEMSAPSGKQNKIPRKFNSFQNTCDTKDQMVSSKKKKSSVVKNLDNHGNDLTHRGFRLGSFQ